MLAMAATPAHAQPVLPAAPENRAATGGQTAIQPQEQAPATGLWDRANLIPDLGGIRSTLAARGLTFGLSENGEVFGNASGGTRRGTIVEGLAQFGVGLDTEKAFGWQGGTFNASAFQIHGRGLSLNNLANNFHTVSSLEAYRGTLLFELWYQQAFFNKKLEIRVGQLAVDQEFMISQYGGLFLNHTFGWSTLPSTDLPSGGAAYPLATPGVRVRWFTPPLFGNDLTVLAAILNGNPAGPGAGIPQYRDASGTAFRTSDGVFAIAEAQFATNQNEGATSLPGIYKLGVWYNTQAFADQRVTATGLSLANPLATTPRNRRGNYSLYAVADQLVWRATDQKDGGIGVFARIMGATGDRNLVNLYVDAGVTWKGAIPGRDADTIGLGLAIARISDTTSQLDSDVARSTATAYPIRRHETVLELTYQAQIAPWLQLQPTAQYIFNPNGSVPNPLVPSRRLNDAAVFGLRTAITF